MAIALTLGLIAWIEHPKSNGLGNLLLVVVRQLGLGLAVGLVLGAAAAYVFARLPQTIGAFVPVASIAAAALAFGAADTIGGSGFLAVYLVGLALGSTPSRYRRLPSPSTKGSPSSRRSCSSSCSVCSSSHTIFHTSR